MDKRFSDDAALEQTVSDVCLRKNFQFSHLATAGVCVVSVLCAIPAWSLVPHDIVIKVVLATFAYQSVMLAICQWYYRQRRYTFSYRHHSFVAIGIYGISGLLIAVGSIVYLHYGGMAMFVYVIAFHLGLAEGSLGTSAYHVPAMFAYLLTSTPVFLVYLLTMPGDSTVTLIAVGLAFNAFYCIWVGLQQARNIRTAIRLQHRNDALLIELRDQTRIAEKARQVAELSSEEKSRFFASASHDLLQPVHALNLYTSLLMGSPNSADREEILQRIDGCVHTLSDLFKALLTVTRVESGAGLQSQIGPFPLQAAIDSAMALFRPMAVEHGVELRSIPSRCWVHGEQVAIERILGNLLSNAIRFAPSGRVRVGVRRRPGHAELQVLDTGIGISEAEQPRIFDEFYQVDNPGRRADKGFGLGLVIVQRLCNSLGYRVSLKSEPGKGSCFGVRMPLAAPVERPRLASEPVLTPDFDARVRVLVVDDEPTVRDAMARLFENWNVAAEICASSVECLARLGDGEIPWTCVILDQRLGEAMTGLELAAVVATRIGCDVPIAIMTGENEGGWVEQARAGGYAVFSKPVKTVRLRAFIASSFNKRFGTTPA